MNQTHKTHKTQGRPSKHLKSPQHHKPSAPHHMERERALGEYDRAKVKFYAMYDHQRDLTSDY